MNKKVNTLLFILGATVFNVLLAVSLIILLFILLLFIVNRFFPSIGQDWIFPLSFLAGIVISFIVYRLVLKLLAKKIDLEKYLDPIFVKTNIRKNRPS